MIAEAGDFLGMMRCAFHEVWRRQYSGGSEISLISVMAIYDDCQYYRNELARICTKDYEEGRSQAAIILKINFELDATWRSLLHSVTLRKEPSFVRRRV